jgi:uncharacterized membrane protein
MTTISLRWLGVPLLLLIAALTLSIVLPPPLPTQHVPVAFTGYHVFGHNGGMSMACVIAAIATP